MAYPPGVEPGTYSFGSCSSFPQKANEISDLISKLQKIAGNLSAFELQQLLEVAFQSNGTCSARAPQPLKPGALHEKSASALSLKKGGKKITK